MASGVRKLAANLAYARRAAKRLGLGEVASSISRVLQAVVEQEAKSAASHEPPRLIRVWRCFGLRHVWPLKLS